MPCWPRPAGCSSGSATCRRGWWCICCWPARCSPSAATGRAGRGWAAGGPAARAAGRDPVTGRAGRRVGAAPLAALFDLLRGSPAGPATRGVWWHGRLVCAVDGSTLCCPDTPANLAVYRKGGGHHGGTGYPLVRLAALVACGTRALLAATFGSTGIDEREHAAGLLGALHPGMLVLADRNFGYRPTLTALAGTGADLLVRVKAGRRLPVCRRCGDGSWLSRIGPLEVRVLRAQITIATAAGARSELYQLVTTVTDPGCAADLIRLYHQRWEIETAYAELKQSILTGRLLRARTPAGIEQEIYALLV